MAQGDHIYVNLYRGQIPYQHHGIDVGDGTVVHLASTGASGEADSCGEPFRVQRVSLEDFASGQPVQRVAHGDALPADRIVSNALKAVGTRGYSLLNANCEHFAAGCATGRATSRQIEISEATVSALVSGGAKAACALSGRVAGRLLVKGASKANPVALVADGVEVAVLAAGCQTRLSGPAVRSLARVSGCVTAAGVGALVGGPVGAASFFALHTSSTALADKAVATLRRFF